ncbi:MAG: serine/threonine protein kinase [Hydrogenophilales bacterium]|nr:serine/threonine protein kinase [Hydrogenophilales bacterium]
MATQIVEPLPAGFLLDEYRIDRRIGGGGFSMVYLAYDGEGEPVALKEYLPDGVVRRNEDYSVAPMSEEKERSFRQGMRFFFDEGRTLAHIRHPNVVRVLSFFRANETVYMVMKYERGKTLQRHIQEMGDEPMRESYLRGIFIRLLNGLREVHASRLLHLDIKPSNIYIRSDATPVLIDFGAARQALSGDAHTFTPMYTPGFAAPEQYGQRDRLGPWTDIYAAGASIYACLAKAPPPPANERLEEDKFQPAANRLKGLYTAPFLELVDSMLRLNYLERPQSVFTVQKHLIAVTPIEKPVPAPGILAQIRDRLQRPL